MVILRLVSQKFSESENRKSDRTENNRKILEGLNSEEKTQPIADFEKKAIGYCEYCGSEINHGAEEKTCGFCRAHFEDEEEQNKLKKIYSEFKDVIDYNSKFKRIIDEENKKINGVS